MNGHQKKRQKECHLNYYGMKTQLTMTDTKLQKRKDAFFIFYESVLKPDSELRLYAHDQECYNELMEWRQEIITYLDERRNQEFYS